ncbi:MAG: type II secretion system F family protein [Gemmatimonadetes bacterium]|nr:type II secretion system F family protein [Gemmatimonadota bacterium]
MIFLVVALTAISVGLLVLGLTSISPADERVVRKRLAALQTGATSYRDLSERRRREAKRERLTTVLEAFGQKVGAARASDSNTKQWLVHGGYRHPNAAGIFVALRVLLAAVFGVGSFLLLAVVAPGFGFSMPFMAMVMSITMLALFGFMVPFFVVDAKVKSRQLAISKALPDTLDLLVVCVEAGLGLNQALVRVSDEVDRISTEMSDELTIVNLEIRAGTPRDEALRRLGQRTGVDDVRALTSMLLQTDRFGTSIADSLRIHAETLRSKRMQRAEEAAAKTTVKMLFPLIFFIFPSIFVVLVGPAVFLFRDFFGGLQ